MRLPELLLVELVLRSDILVGGASLRSLGISLSCCDMNLDYPGVSAIEIEPFYISN